MPKQLLLPLALNARKVIASVIACGRAMQPLRIAAEHAGALFFGERVDSLVSELSSAGIKSSDSEKLEDFVDQVLGNLAAAVPALCSQCRDLEGPILESIRAVRNAKQCSDCSNQLARPVCDGKTSDAHTVSAGGHCLKDILDQFQAALGVTSEYYIKFGSLLTLRPVYFQICVEKDDDLPFRISGLTKLDHHEDFAIVTLGVHLEAFSWCSYLAILYVLFHECVSHCFSRLIDVDKDDAFGEGWMDHVACTIMEEYLLGLHPGNVSVLHYANDRSEQGRGLCTLRRNAGNANGRIRSQGNDAATRLQKHLAQVYSSERLLDPRECFYRLSFSINLSDMKKPERLNLIRTVRLSLPSGSLSDDERSPDTLALEEAILRFARDGDLGAFRERLSPLPRPRMPTPVFLPS